MDNKYERIEQLQNAQQMIKDATQLIREAIKGTPSERGSEQYILGHLDNWSSEDNGMDDTLPKIIRSLEEWEGIED